MNEIHSKLWTEGIGGDRSGEDTDITRLPKRLSRKCGLRMDYQSESAYFDVHNNVDVGYHLYLTVVLYCHDRIKVAFKIRSVLWKSYGNLRFNLA